jgi:hypothetical protein
MSKEELLELLKKSLQDALDSIQDRDKEELNEDQINSLKNGIKKVFEKALLDKCESKHILNKVIENKAEFLKMFNPWQNEEYKLIKKFVNTINNPDSNKDFSWLEILEKDEQWKKSWEESNKEVKLKEEVTDKNKHVNMRYQIPTHFHGDIDNAVIFHCMENPRGYLGEYEDSYIDKELGGADLEEYFGKTYKLLNEDNSSNKSIKQIIKERYQLGEGEIDSKNIPNITNIIYSDKSNLSRELDNMFNESKDFFTKEYTLKKNNRSKKDDLSERYYYLAQYYAQLLEIDGKNMRKLDDEPGNEDTEGRKKARKIAKKICNLEIYPFSCKDPKLGNNGIGEKILLNSDLSRLGAYIVLRRIYKYLVNETPQKPVFVFRKYDRAWEKLFKKTFEEVGAEDNFLQDLESQFFYCQTSQQGGGITSGNVISVRDFKALELLKELAFRDIFDLITEKKD